MTNQSRDDFPKVGAALAPCFEKLTRSVSRIHLRGGAVGKVSTVLVVVAIVVGVVAWSVRDPWIAGIGLVGLLFLVYALGNRMLRFAEKNPYAAMLEGADLLMHQQIEMGMKGTPVLPVDPDALTMEPGVPLTPSPPEDLDKPDEPPAAIEPPIAEGGLEDA